MSEDKGAGTPPAVQIADPDQELERKLRRDPGNEDAKVDVGSDESMDGGCGRSSGQRHTKERCCLRERWKDEQDTSRT